MNEASTAPAHAKTPRRKFAKRPHVVVPTASLVARKMAAAILEVLAGARTPSDAAQALAVSVPRYYLIEQRGLLGLVAACEPRVKGPGKRPHRRIADLEKEVERLKRERDRHQALARASQRTVGLLASARPPTKDVTTGSKKKRKRRPAVRALSIANSLRETDVGESTAADLQQSAVEETTSVRMEGDA